MPNSPIPATAQAQLRAAVGSAMAPAGVSSLVAPKAPDLSAIADYKDEVLKGIEAILGAIDTFQRFAWVLPPQAAGVIPITQTIENALNKVKSWLD